MIVDGPGIYKGRSPNVRIEIPKEKSSKDLITICDGCPCKRFNLYNEAVCVYGDIFERGLEKKHCCQSYASRNCKLNEIKCGPPGEPIEVFKPERREG